MYLIQHDQIKHSQRVAYLYLMTQAERALLPEDGSYCLAVEIEDRTTGKTYPIRDYYLATDNEVAIGEPDLRCTLLWHSYYWHYCPCNRQGDIRQKYPDPSLVPQDGCDDGRYLIRSITHPALPNVNLYRGEWVSEGVPDNWTVVD